MISSIILAGGRATRMNGVDKGLVLLQNKPLITHVVERLKPQVAEILINANREIAQYQTFGYPVLKDIGQQDVTDECLGTYIGPLAGFSLGLQYAKHEYVLTMPCDSPLLPADLAQRLLGGMAESLADIAVASSDGNAHPVFCLMKKNVLPSLIAFLEAGERKVSAWQKSLNYIEVDFSGRHLNSMTDAFINLNTFDDLKRLELMR